ncbi:MAG: alpha/beta fold hydrolase [Dongiaceae bacterium]
MTPDSGPLPRDPSAMLRVADGVELYVHRSGEGPPLLLLHGVGCCGDDWIGATAHLRGRFRVIRPDTRGHGRSGAPAGPWRLADFLGDLVGILDRLGVARAHVAGFSMGGLLAQGLAIHHPERVERLAILAATTGRSPEEQAQIAGRLDFIRAHHPGEYFDTHAAGRWFTPEFRRESPAVVDYIRRVVAANDHQAYVKAYEVLVANDLGPELHRIAAPTLVLTGDDDIGAGPKAARFIAGEIPGARLILLPRLRHQLLLEAPELVGGILREFFTAAG